MIIASLFTNIINSETFLNCLKYVFPNLILFSRLKFTLIFLTMGKPSLLSKSKNEREKRKLLFMADITLLPEVLSITLLNVSTTDHLGLYGFYN